MGADDDLSVIRSDAEAYRILTSSRYNYETELSSVQATDEIITIFCRLHGGLEEAMPIIRTQFKKARVDFANPNRDGLNRVVRNLIEVTTFLKGSRLAELERKRFEHIIKCIGSTSERVQYT